VFAVSIQCLEINEPTILIIVAQMNNMPDIILYQIWKKDIFVKSFLIVNENITAVTNAAVSIIE